MPRLRTHPWLTAEPILILAGDTRIMIRGTPPHVDLRLVSEGNFQRAAAALALIGELVMYDPPETAELQRRAKAIFLMKDDIL